MPTDDASRIAEALEATKQIVAELDQRARVTEQILTEIKSDLRQVTDTASRLAQLIWTGNGTDSLLTRMSLIERTVSEQKQQLKESREAQAKFKAALIPALLGLVGTLAAALIALFK